MDNTQSQAQAPVDNRLTQAQNPQAPGGQALTNAAGNLQTGTTDILNSPGKISITSVGDTTFRPFDSSATTKTATVESSPKPVSNHYPVIILGGAVIIICLIAAWMMARYAQKQQLKDRR